MSSRARSESVVAHDAHQSSGAATGVQWEPSFDHRPRNPAIRSRSPVAAFWNPNFEDQRSPPISQRGTSATPGRVDSCTALATRDAFMWAVEDQGSSISIRLPRHKPARKHRGEHSVPEDKVMEQRGQRMGAGEPKDGIAEPGVNRRDGYARIV